MKRVIVACLAVILLIALAVPGPVAASQQISFTVVFRQESLPPDADAIVAAAGGTVTYRVPRLGLLQARGDHGLLYRLQADPAILAVSPTVPLPSPQLETAEAFNTLDLESSDSPPNLFEAYQWDVKRVTANGASFALGSGSHDVVVGVIDSGIYAEHPDLKANLLGGRNMVPAGGYWGLEPDETGDPDDLGDRIGHGTVVASHIAANGRMKGIAPNLGIRAYRVGGSMIWQPEWVWAAMVAAADDGVDVISMSLGSTHFMGQIFYVDPVTGERTLLGNDWAYFVGWRRAVQYANQHGALVVVAAGNFIPGADLSNKHAMTAIMNEMYAEFEIPIYLAGATFKVPADLPGVLSVSATTIDDTLASYSNYGAGIIDLAAPGGDFSDSPDEYRTQVLAATNPNSLNPEHQGRLYTFTLGTSLAAPKVAAVAGLIIDHYGPIGPDQVARILRSSADDLGQPGYDNYFGHGLVNAYRALGGQ